MKFEEGKDRMILTLQEKNKVAVDMTSVALVVLE
jgi:hypothetical protein